MARYLPILLLALGCQPLDIEVPSCTGYPMTSCMGANQLCVQGQCVDICTQDQDCESGWCRKVGNGQELRACEALDP